MAQPEAPEWLESTPNWDYQLHAIDADCASEQLIRLTREEFILLKVRLGELRGYVMPEDVPAALRELS